MTKSPNKDILRGSAKASPKVKKIQKSSSSSGSRKQRRQALPAYKSVKMQPSVKQSPQDTNLREEGFQDSRACKIYCFLLLKQLFGSQNYSLHTYLLALIILKQFQFQCSKKRCIQIAGTIFFLVAKFNETQNIFISEMVQWSDSILTKQSIVETQFLILEWYQYDLPLQELIDSQDQQTIKEKCNALQIELNGDDKDFNIQQKQQ